VAIVSTTGEVIAKAKGTTTITVTTQDGSKTAKCTVTVTQPVTKIEILNPSGKAETFHWQYITYKDKTYKLSAKVYPTNANNTKVTWRSSNTDAFTVDQNGLVTFKKESFNDYVIAEAQDGSGVVGRIDFSINERTANQITLTSSGGTGSYQTRPNGTFKVTAALSPDPFNNKVTWSLSSTSCAKIESTTDLTCTIRGLKNTTASNPVILTATYRSLNGEVTKTVSKQIGILGTPYISEIRIGEYMQVTAGSSYNTSATVTPSTADVKAVEWVTSNSSILKLTYDDPSDKRRVRLNGVKKGTVTIYCRATDGSGVKSNETRVDVQ
ncbi:MAG: Ig-like domain-containing protein, partial [Bacteroidales bacterium]|nr:Ig-like domain-containing protein [Bacteroidales bacterium]